MEVVFGLVFLFVFVVILILFSIGFGLVTEKALNKSDQWKQTRQQESKRAQEPQNVLLRAGMLTDAQPQTLVRPAVPTEQSAPETLLRPAEADERE